MGTGGSVPACESRGKDFCSTVSHSTGCVSVGDSFRCSCEAGFSSKGTNIQSTCEDIDECALGQDACRAKLLHSMCVNTPGSFECRCNEFRTQNGNVCEDINECLVDRGGCAEFSECINNEDAPVTCKCFKGYTGNDGVPGRACKDINECEEPDHCPANTICVNTPGSFRCDCKPGYIKDEKGNCAGVSFCTAHNNNCDPVFAVCEDIPESYKCVCKKNFEGSGKKGDCKPLPGFEFKACELQGIECGDYQKCVPDLLSVGKYTCHTLSRMEQAKVFVTKGLSTDTPLWLWSSVAAGGVILTVILVLVGRKLMKRYRRDYDATEIENYPFAGTGYDYGAAQAY